MDADIYQEDRGDLLWMLQRISELVWENDPDVLDEIELIEIINEIREIIGNEEEWHDDS